MVGWVDCSGVIIKLKSVQLQLQLPAGTELGNILLQFRLISNTDATKYLCAHEINESMTAFGADDEILKVLFQDLISNTNVTMYFCAHEINGIMTAFGLMMKFEKFQDYFSVLV